jgi:hypothetical protein
MVFAVVLGGEGIAHAGAYDLRSSYAGTIEDTRGWIIEWELPNVPNRASAQAVVGQWYFNLESGVYGGADDFGVYYFGDDNGLDDNNPLCGQTWPNAGGICSGALGRLSVDRKVSFKYEWCDADHTADVNGPLVCVYADVGDGTGWRYLASDTRTTVELYAHDIENFRDGGGTMPQIPCSTPTRMLKQQVKTPGGDWVDLKDGAWKFFAEPTQRWIFLNHTPTSWESCSLPKAQDCGTIAIDTGLLDGESVATCDGNYTLGLTAGKLSVVDKAGAIAWEPPISTSEAARTAIMQSDGNFVLYTVDGRPIWATGTDGTTNAALDFAAGGEVTIKANGKTAWSSSQTSKTPGPAADVSTARRSSSPKSAGETPSLSDVIAPGSSGCAASPRPSSSSPLLVVLALLIVACSRRPSLPQAEGEA